MPVSRKSGWENGLLRTASRRQTVQACLFPAVATAKLAKIPVKIGLSGETVSPEELCGLGFWGHLWSILCSRRVCAGGRAKVLDLEDKDKVAPSSSPKTLLRGALLPQFFLGWWDLVFARGFGKKGVVELDVLVVKLWWIAGESWLVDGQLPVAMTSCVSPRHTRRSLVPV